MAEDTTKRKWYCTRWGVAGILLAVLIIGMVIGKASSHHGGRHGGGHHGEWHGDRHGGKYSMMGKYGKNMRGGMQKGGMMQNLITQADADGDFLVTEQEFEALFNQLDSNGDGVLESETMQARKAQMQQMRAEMHGDDDDDDDDDDHHRKGRKGKKGQFMLDSDEDGKISKDEFMAIFTRMDVNQDGVINNELFKLNAS
ncbi:MAG: EF-hand domain-containing protein [Alphaproteobacteria bacterium]|nr:EF-hand domain-containing protein [Alphaproteobacteria bacterium]